MNCFTNAPYPRLTPSHLSTLAGVLLVLASIGGCYRGCAKLIRSPANPSLHVMESRLGRTYSEYPALTYHDNQPWGSLDGVVDYTSGEMQERYGTNITQRDIQEFKRLESQANEENRLKLPF